ncbi:MAG: hypothetical protein COB29_01095, partial [Sulfitobacter sp.]
MQTTARMRASSPAATEVAEPDNSDDADDRDSSPTRENSTRASAAGVNARHRAAKAPSNKQKQAWAPSYHMSTGGVAPRLQQPAVQNRVTSPDLFASATPSISESLLASDDGDEDDVIHDNADVPASERNSSQGMPASYNQLTGEPLSAREEALEEYIEDEEEAGRLGDKTWAQIEREFDARYKQPKPKAVLKRKAGWVTKRKP